MREMIGCEEVYRTLSKASIPFCVATGLLVSGCGLFGEKPEPDPTIYLSQANAGCLNEFGPQVTSYLAGTVSTDTWQSSWDCVSGSLKTFTQFARGSVEGGYSREDMHSFASHFLVTTKEISTALIDASFELKAALLGGSPDLLTPSEIERLLLLIDVAKTETSKLIPLLAKYANDATDDDLLQLADSLKSGAQTLGTQFEGTSGGALSLDTIRDMASELGALHGWEINLDWIKFSGLAKALLAGGAEDGIDPSEWGPALRAAGAVGGIAFAVSKRWEELNTDLKANETFLLALADRAVEALNDMADRRPEGTASSLIDSVVSTLPILGSEGSQDLILSLYRPLKSLLVAGDSELLTAEELRQVVSLARDASPAMITYFSFSPEARANKAQLAEIYLPLVKSAVPLLKNLVQRHGGTLSTSMIDDLLMVLDQKVGLFNSEDLKEICRASKKVLLGGETESITDTEWSQFLELINFASDPIFTLLMTNFYEVTQSRKMGETLNPVFQTLRDALEPIVEWHGGSLAFSDLNALLEKLPEDLLPLDCESIKKMLSVSKRILVGGDNESISSTEWTALLDTTIEGSKLVFKVMDQDLDAITEPNGAAEFLLALGYEANQVFLEPLLSRHGGAIPLALVDEWIFSIPPSWIPNCDKCQIDAEVVSITLKPFVNRVLFTKVPDAIDTNVFATALGLIEQWVRRQTYLERLFTEYAMDPMGVSPQEFKRSAADLRRKISPSEGEHVKVLANIAGKYRPMFVGDDSQITYTRFSRISKNHMSQMNWAYIAGGQMLDAYATDRRNRLGSLEDLTKIISDFDDFGFALRFINKDIPDIPAKRYRELDLFTFASDGDGYVGFDEAVYYLAFLASSKTLSRRILYATEEACFNEDDFLPGNPRYGEEMWDPLGWGWMRIECFREVLRQNLRSYLDFFPHMTDFYDTLDSEEKEQVLYSIEQASRYYGYSNAPIASYDVESITGIIHFVETMFQRFDADEDKILNLPDSMSAYPIFKRTIIQIAADQGQAIDEDNDELIEAVFTYLLRYKKPPVTTDFWGMSHFLGWFVWRPFWAIQADRKDLFEIIAYIAGGQPPDKRKKKLARK